MRPCDVRIGTSLVRNLHAARLEEDSLIRRTGHRYVETASDVKRQRMGEIGAISQPVAEMNRDWLCHFRPPRIDAGQYADSCTWSARCVSILLALARRSHCLHVDHASFAIAWARCRSSWATRLF